PATPVPSVTIANAVEATPPARVQTASVETQSRAATADRTLARSTAAGPADPNAPRANERNVENIVAAQVRAYGKLTPDQVALEQELLAEIAAETRKQTASLDTGFVTASRKMTDDLNGGEG
ncbi:MAG: hypothetical protein AAF220_11930, partial [Pseudomonadota bacterium]